MRFFTLLLAFFVAFTSAKLWDKLLIPNHAKPHKADSSARVTATVSVPADPSCKKDSDCQTGSSSGQCVNGISIPWEPVKYGPGKGVVVRRDQLFGRAIAEESFAKGEEEDIMKDLGDNDVEVDGPSGRFNVKKREVYQFDGSADDGSHGEDKE